VFGTDANNETGTLKLFGWHKTGPGQRIGDVALVLSSVAESSQTADPDFKGFHQDIRTDQSIRDAFTATVDYFACDTYTVSVDTEAALTARNLADNQSYLDVNLGALQYDWLLAHFTLDGALPAATLGAVYIPVSLKAGHGEILLAS
jgi:hypothetical protein